MADRHKMLRVALNKLHFDLENPRHDPLQNEAAAMEKLLATGKVIELARHIAENGTSPLDLLAVCDLDGMPGHYTVLEGNRRLCALKLLHDPSKATSTTTRRIIEGLPRGGHTGAAVNAIWFANRDAARRWLEVRHQGEQDGVGTVKWTASQKARFDARSTAPSNPNRLALELIEYAKQRGLITAQDASRLAITTLTRYLSNPNVRDALGLERHDMLKFGFDQSEVDKAIQHFLRDALPAEDGTPPTVHSRARKAERVEYARSLRHAGTTPQTRLTSPVVPDPASTLRTSAPRVARSSTHPEKRSRVIPPGWITRSRDVHLRRLHQELRTIDPDSHPYAANYLLRAFIERTLVLYMKKKKIGPLDMSGHLKINKCVEALAGDGVDGSVLKVMRTASSNKDALHSLDTLGAAVHAGQVPDRRTLFKVWDNWQAALDSMLGVL